MTVELGLPTDTVGFAVAKEAKAGVFLAAVKSHHRVVQSTLCGRFTIVIERIYYALGPALLLESIQDGLLIGRWDGIAFYQCLPKVKGAATGVPMWSEVGRFVRFESQDIVRRQRNGSGGDRGNGLLSEFNSLRSK